VAPGRACGGWVLDETDPWSWRLHFFGVARSLLGWRLRERFTQDWRKGLPARLRDPAHRAESFGFALSDSKLAALSQSA
jgi:hypothetical protein